MILAFNNTIKYDNTCKVLKGRTGEYISILISCCGRFIDFLSGITNIVSQRQIVKLRDRY